MGLEEYFSLWMLDSRILLLVAGYWVLDARFLDLNVGVIFSRIQDRASSIQYLTLYFNKNLLLIHPPENQKKKQNQCDSKSK